MALAPVPLHPPQGCRPELPRALVLRLVLLVRLLRVPVRPVRRLEPTVGGRRKVQPALVPILDWEQPAAPGQGSERAMVVDHPRRVRATKAVHRVTVAVRHRSPRAGRMLSCGQIRQQPAKDRSEGSRRETRPDRTRFRWEPPVPRQWRRLRPHH